MVLVLGSFVLLVWQAPNIVLGSRLFSISDAAQQATAEYNARVLVLSLAGGIVVVTSLILTAMTYVLNSRGQITERFSKALERLGSDELYIRLGGVHALEHVMVDSPRHHSDVVEVLLAFIRQKTPRVAHGQDERSAGRWMHPPTDHRSPTVLPDEPSVDIQAALTVLARRPVGKQRLDPSVLDLSGLHLAKVNLASAHLVGADLSGSNLASADLDGANLAGARLFRANLTSARLIGSVLTRAMLSWATLPRANLARADLTDAQLVGANLAEANLYAANMTSAFLWQANLTKASLYRANLTKTKLDIAILTDAVLDGATLNGTFMTGTDLNDVHNKQRRSRPDRPPPDW